MRHACPALLEPLESRIAPAGVVLVEFADGRLQITGDADANQIDILGTPTGFVIFDGGAGDTQFSYAGELLVQVDLAGVIRSIHMDLETGAGKTVSVSNLTVTRNVRIQTGVGGENVTFDTVNIRGQLAVTNIGATDGDRVAITGGATTVGLNLFVSAEEFVVDSLSLTAGSIFVAGTNDGNIVRVTPRESLTVTTGGITLGVGKSDAEIVSDHVAITGNVFVDSADFLPSPKIVTIGARTVGVIDGTVVLGSGEFFRPTNSPLEFNLGVPGGKLTIDGKVFFEGSEAEDSVQFAGTLTVPHLTVELYAGEDQLKTDDLRALTATRTVAIRGGPGADKLTLDAEDMLNMQNLFMSGEGGADVMMVGGRVVKVGYTLAFSANTEAGAQATATLRASALRVERFLDVRHEGEGGLTTTMAPTSFALPGVLNYVGFQGVDNLSIETAVLMRAGNMALAMGFSAGGAGANSFSLTALSGGRHGRITYFGDAGDDSFTYRAAVAETGRIKVLGDRGGQNTVLVEPPAAGLRVGLTAPLIVRGETIFSSQEEITLRDVDARRVVFKTGVGADTVRIADSTFAGRFVADLGADADRFEAEVGSGPLPTAFHEFVNVQLGAGDDELVLGESAAFSRIQLASTAVFNGGDDEDTRLVAPSALVVLGPEPVFTGFEPP